MRPTTRAARIAILTIGASLGVGNRSATAQDFGTLGGYGSASTYANPGMARSTPMIVPYGGMFEGFMPGRTGGGSSMSFRSRPAEAMGSPRAAFRLAPMAGGMGTSPPARGRGMGLGGGMVPGGAVRKSLPGGASVMPPSISYPFRQPPSLAAPSGGAAGMPM